MAPRLVVCALASLLAACAASLHQLPPDQEHAVLEVRFEQVSRDFLYDTKLSIDGGEDVAVRSGQRIRLRPGSHALELVSVAHEYGLGTVTVRKPGPCVDPRCAFQIPVSERQAAVVEVGRYRCARKLDVSVAAGSELVAVLKTSAEHSCVAFTTPGPSGRD